ncbi:MAG: RHS repeat domain-containing protein, partial [Acidobacteriota bacterium]
MTYYSSDGSYLRLTVERNQDWTLYYPDGSKVINQGAMQRVYERNGNYYEITNNTITDNFGRSTTWGYDAATGDDLITQTGVGNTPLVWRIRWKIVSIVNKGYSSTAATGGQQQGNTSIQQWTLDYLVIDKIILPTQLGNLSYTFNYDTSTGWAEVSSIVMPADASETPPQVAYQYAYPGPPANGLPKSTNILRGHASTKTLTWYAQTDGATTPTTETWLYNVGNTVTYITAPDGGITTELHGDTSQPVPDSGLLMRVERPDGTKTERLYALNTQPWLGFVPPSLSEQNAFAKTEFTSIKDAGGNYVKTAIKDFAYDKNGNALQVTEYDWVDYSLVTRDVGDLPTGIPGGLTPKRVTLNTYNNPTPDFSTPGNHANAYWNVAPAGGYTTLTLNAIESKETRATAAGAVQARTEYAYDDPATTANVTVARSWDSTKGAVTTPLTSGNSIATTNQYGTYSNGATGKLIKTFDAKNLATGYTYGDIGNGVTDLYVTKTIVAEGTAVARTSETKYDFHTGVTVEAKDTDNNVVTQVTLDVFGRPTRVKEAFGTPAERHTITEYSDTLRRVVTRSDLNTTGDGKLVSIQHYDQLDRLRLSRTLEESATQDPYNEQHGIKAQTRYAYSGSNSYEIVSAAYRATTSGAAGGEAEMAWRRIKNDQSGKIIELESFAGAAPPAPWGNNATSTGKVTTAYDADFTTVTDQVNRSRRSMVDGIGRLVRVDEPDAVSGNLGATSSPVQPTNYTYNALDRLTQTVQGVQTRTFSYSSLSRLISATNPENGTVSYTYDNNGNLLTKTDARGFIANYAYDALNRNTNIYHTNPPSVPPGDFTITPSIARFYDNPAPGKFGKGRLHYQVAAYSQNGGPGERRTTIDEYDELGRVKQQTQRHSWHVFGGTFATYDYPVYRTYDRAGN